MPIVIIGAAIAAAAAAGSAAIKQDAARKAANTQKDAVKKLKGTDLEKAKTMTADQDKAYYLQSKQFFREQDPQLAAARDSAVAKMQESVSGTYQPDVVLAQSMKENLPQDSRVEKIRQTLLQRAQEDLNLGATLPPEYQAQLIQAGLENAAATGVGANRLGPVTARTGTLLGQAGLELKSAREKAAMDLLGADASLKAARASVLGNLLSEAAQTAAGKAQLASGVAQFANQNTPSVGLRGQDLLQLQLANEQLERSKTMTTAQLNAMKIMSNAAAQASYVETAGKFAQSAVGAAGGGGGGMAAGAGGGGGGGGFTPSNNFGGQQAGSQMSQMYAANGG